MSETSANGAAAPVDELVALAGGNPLPIYLAVRARTPRTLHVLYTKQTEEIAERLADKDGRAPILGQRSRNAGPKTSVISVEKHRVDCGSDDAGGAGRPDHAKTLQTVTRLVEQARENGERIGLDYTGGTKLMSVAAARPFEPEQRSYVWHGLGNAKLHLDSGVGTTLPAEAFPNLHTIARLHGHVIPEATPPPALLEEREALANLREASGLTHLWEGYEKPADVWDAISKACEEAMRCDVNLRIDLLQKASRARTRDRALKAFDSTVPKFAKGVRKAAFNSEWDANSLLEPLEGVRLLAEKGYKADKRRKAELVEAAVWAMRTATTIVTGGWLERLAERMLRRDGNEQSQVLRNVHLGRHPHAPELDVVHRYGTRVNVVSCTTRDHWTTLLQKATEALHRAEQFGGSVASAALVCTTESQTADRLRTALEAAWPHKSQKGDHGGGRPRVFTRDDLKAWVDGDHQGALLDWAEGR